MNWGVLKDLKIILAFTLAFVFEIIAIVLAFKNDDSDSWVPFIVFGLLLTVYSVNRANRLYSKK